MKSVLISIQPKWCELIANGSKTIEVRKSKPKLDVPFKCYIYCTQGDSLNYLKRPIFDNCSRFWIDNKAYGANVAKANGKVIGEFVCDNIGKIYQCNSGWVGEYACVPKDKFFDYLGIPRGTHFGYGKSAYGWHISDLKIYDKPKELGEFKKIHRECWYADLGLAKRDCPECKNKECFMKRPPQSWCYVESEVTEE